MDLYNIIKSRMAHLISYGVGSIVTYTIIVSLASLLWSKPQFMFSHVGIVGFAFGEYLIVFIVTLIWAFVLYKPNLKSLRSYVLIGESIGIMSFITLGFIVTATRPSIDDVFSFIEILISLFILAGILFGWLVVINSFVISYLLFRFDKKKSK